MSDLQTDSTASSMSSPRLAQFEEEVGKLKVTGGGANPERLASQWGIGLVIVGFVIAIISWFSAQDSNSTILCADNIDSRVRSNTTSSAMPLDKMSKTTETRTSRSVRPLG